MASDSNKKITVEQKEPTADQLTVSERCPLNPALDNDLRIIAKKRSIDVNRWKKLLVKWTE